MKRTVLILLAVFLVSCAPSKTKPLEANALFEILTQQADGGASIRFFEILSDEKEIAMLQNDEKLKNKIKPEDVKTASFIVFNMGEKTTAGHKISIESAVETDKNIIITIKEVVPKSTAIDFLEVTKPYFVVKVNSKKEIII